MTRLLTSAAVLAFVAGTWLLDLRWLVTGAGAFVVLGLAGGVVKGRKG